MHLAAVLRDTELGPEIRIMVLDKFGSPVLELPEDEWKELVNDSWEVLSKANSKLYDLANKGKFKIDPFTIIVDRSIL